MKRNNETGRVSVALILVLAAFAAVGLSLYSYAVGIRNEALKRELDVAATYSSLQVELSNMVSTVYEQVGIANLKSDKMNEIIKGAIEGRYGDDGFKGGTFAAAITEAYPGTEGLNIYDKVLPTVAALREGFRNKQNVLIDKARSFNNWRKEGVFRAWVLSGIYPSRDLKITVGDKTYYASEALDKLERPIVTSSTTKAFDTNTLEPLDFGAKK